MENLKELFEMEYQYLKEIKMEEVNLKRELKKYKVLAFKRNRQLNRMDQLSISSICHSLEITAVKGILNTMELVLRYIIIYPFWNKY